MTARILFRYGKLFFYYLFLQTYKIEDIDWEQNLLSTFNGRDGRPVTYKDYYSQRYGVQIRDLQQPLLLTKVKAFGQLPGRPAGEDEYRMISLVPELCYMTGLSEEQRNNYPLMTVTREVTTDLKDDA